MNRKFVASVWWSYVLVLLAALLIAITSCAGRGRLEPPARAGDKNSRLVAYTLTFVSGRACNLENARCANVAWERSGWHDLMDMTDPILVVVDAGNNACPVWRDSIRAPRPNEYYVCPTNWRVWRQP